MEQKIAFILRNRLFFKLYNKLVRKISDPSVVADVQGHKMYLDPLDTLNLSVRGVWGPFETETFKKQIKKGDTVLDIGGHIGYYTLISAKLVGESGKVYVFEPDPTNFSILKKNVELNGYKNVVLVNKAVSDKTGKCKLYLDEKDLGGHSINDIKDKMKSIEIESVKLDDFLKNEKVDFIKMDIEGAEPKAIKGMGSILKRNNDVKIFMEFVPHFLRKSGTTPEEFLKTIRGLGFKIYNVKELEHNVETMTIEESVKMEKETRGTNLLCIRQ